MTKILCGRQEQTNIALEERCEGLAETFEGEVVSEFVGLDADPTEQENQISALLQADPDDRRLHGHRPEPAAAGDRRWRVGRARAADRRLRHLAGPDRGDRGRHVAFTVDQQQYLQGYLPVVLMYLQATNLNTAGGGLPILTGPGFVDAENVAERRRAGRSRHPLTHSYQRCRTARPSAGPRSAIPDPEDPWPRVDRGADRRRHEPAARRPSTSGSRFRGPIQRLLVRPEIGALIGTTAVWVFFWAVADVFGTAAGTANYLDVAATLGIMAVAVSLLMIGGEFDLSSGSMTGATAMLVILLSKEVGELGGAGLSLFIAVPLSFAFAMMIGWFNGTIVDKTGCPASSSRSGRSSS